MPKIAILQFFVKTLPTAVGHGGTGEAKRHCCVLGLLVVLFVDGYNLHSLIQLTEHTILHPRLDITVYKLRLPHCAFPLRLVIWFDLYLVLLLYNYNRYHCYINYRPRCTAAARSAKTSVHKSLRLFFLNPQFFRISYFPI